MVGETKMLISQLIENLQNHQAQWGDHDIVMANWDEQEYELVIPEIKLIRVTKNSCGYIPLSRVSQYTKNKLKEKGEIFQITCLTNVDLK